MYPVFSQKQQFLEPATDLVGAKTTRRSQDIEKENDNHALRVLWQETPNKRPRLFEEGMACTTLLPAPANSGSSVILPLQNLPWNPDTGRCVSTTVHSIFFGHIRPEQACSPSFASSPSFKCSPDQNLSDLSDDEPMDGQVSRTVRTLKAGTPREQEARVQDGFVTPTGCDDELLGLLGQTSPQDNLQRLPSGLAKILEARLAGINLGPKGE